MPDQFPSEVFRKCSLEQVVKILESGELLWGEGSGAASLQWCRKEKYKGESCYVPIPGRPSLIILFNRPHGFHFRFDVGDEEYVALIKNSQSKRVAHTIGGEPAYFPSASFVPLDTARKVVKSFVESGNRYGQLTWVESSGFRFDLPNEWKKLA